MILPAVISQMFQNDFPTVVHGHPLNDRHIIAKSQTVIHRRRHRIVASTLWRVAATRIERNLRTSKTAAPLEPRSIPGAVAALLPVTPGTCVDKMDSSKQDECLFRVSPIVQTSSSDRPPLDHLHLHR